MASDRLPRASNGLRRRNAYAAMKKRDSQLHLAQLDDLLAQREQGKLADYVKKTAKKCKAPK
jgi:hypothetical protein